MWTWSARGLVLAAFVLRAALRLTAGPADFFTNGYTKYIAIAQNLLGGHGFCVAAGDTCASREPLYSLFVAAFVALGDPFHGLVIAQAALGAFAVWLVWTIGNDLFDRRVAILAAAATAISPYAIVHDTALQDTVLVNVLALLALRLWIRGADSNSRIAGAAAGACSALAALVTGRMLVALPFWIAGVAIAGGRERRRQILPALAAMLLLVGGWTARNWLTVRAPVPSVTGLRFWEANHEWTFSHFPAQSIDASYDEAIDHLSADRRAALAKLSGDEIGTDRLLGLWGLEFIAAHPLRAAGGAARKVWVVLSAQLSPGRSGWLQAGYRLWFLPIHVLAIVGLWRSRASWRRHAPAYALLGSFLVVTAIFWAHTSHKSLIDPVLFLYASAAVFQRQLADAG